jgi:hypothetical protein
MSREMKIRPSQLIGLDGTDELAIYCFDRAVNALGDALMAALQDIEAKTKKEARSKTAQVLRKWLPEARSGRPSRSPAKRSG